MDTDWTAADEAHAEVQVLARKYQDATSARRDAWRALIASGVTLSAIAKRYKVGVTRVNQVVAPTKSEQESAA